MLGCTAQHNKQNWTHHSVQGFHFTLLSPQMTSFYWLALWSGRQGPFFFIAWHTAWSLDDSHKQCVSFMVRRNNGSYHTDVREADWREREMWRRCAVNITLLSLMENGGRSVCDWTLVLSQRPTIKLSCADSKALHLSSTCLDCVQPFSLLSSLPIIHFTGSVF